MILVEISINGKIVARAGAEDMGQIFAILCANGRLGSRSNAVVSDAEHVVTLNVSGTTARGGRAPNEELTYLDEELRAGDTVSIRILGEGEPSAAVRSEVMDYEAMDREEFVRSKEYYLSNRARFEGNDG